MIPAILQSMLLAGMGVLLFQLWHRYVAPARLGWIVTIGFLARAVLAQALFWISWLRLPVATHLQTGEGLWFFALDAGLYVPTAFAASEQGFAAIVMHPRNVASVTFVQCLAMFAYLFGNIVSVALLMNLLAYLGVAAIIIRCSRAADELTPGPMWYARGLALAAVSLAPSAVLWSLQPLKDVLNQFLLVAFVGAALLWQGSLQRSRIRSGRVLLSAVVMIATLFGIAGLRWYLAFILLLGSAGFFVITAVMTRGHRLAGFVSGALVFVLLTQSVRVGAGPYIPHRLQPALSPRTSLAAIATLPGLFVDFTESARGGFERSGGATTIRRAQSRKEVVPANQPHATAAEARADDAQQPGREEAATGATAQDSRNAGNPRPTIPGDASDRDSLIVESLRVQTKKERTEAIAPTSAVSTMGPSSHPETLHPNAPSTPLTVEIDSTESAPAREAQISQRQDLERSTPIAETNATTDEGVARERAPAVVAPMPAKANPVATPTATSGGASHATETSTPNAARTQPAKVPQRERKAGAAPRESRGPNPGASPPATPKDPPDRSLETVASEQRARASEGVARVVPPERPTAGESSPVGEEYVLPESRLSRLAVGTSALLVPRSLGQKLGMFDIRGGQGLMWFTDLDTLAFDMIIVAAMILMTARIRSGRAKNAAFWMLVVVTLLLAIPLVYTVTNFGTLFRLRAMVFTGFALIPISLFSFAGHRLDDDPERPVMSPPSTS